MMVEKRFMTEGGNTPRLAGLSGDVRGDCSTGTPDRPSGSGWSRIEDSRRFRSDRLGAFPRSVRNAPEGACGPLSPRLRLQMNRNPVRGRVHRMRRAIEEDLREPLSRCVVPIQRVEDHVAVAYPVD